MLYVVVILAFLVLMFLPGWWANRVLRRHAGERAEFADSGGALARRLLGEQGLAEVRVETSESGDHYDPESRAVRLSPDNYHGRSLTALTVAAHEVGHAIQHHSGYRPLAWRTRLVRVARGAEKLGAALMLITPVILLLTRRPGGGMITALIGAAGFLSAAVVHLVTLPVEFDASFRRALPLLKLGVLEPRDLPAARRILTACALTYVAASLSAMLNLWRWLAILRR